MYYWLEMLMTYANMGKAILKYDNIQLYWLLVLKVLKSVFLNLYFLAQIRLVLLEICFDDAFTLLTGNNAQTK